ncbi:MAG: cupin domain-containing protein [Acidobacteria bacterium]|nr:MAG: cupin domain-containing protein [Acidobacteriota bacterium]
MKKWISLPAALAIVGYALVGWAQTTPPMIGFVELVRGTYEPFKVRATGETVNEGDPRLEFKAEAKTPMDMVVRQFTYQPGADTGWHAHPGPVFITVKTGTLTFYEYDDPTCTPIVVEAGHGYVDTGRGHMARNETGGVAEDVTVVIAPVGVGFRTTLDPRMDSCPPGL